MRKNNMKNTDLENWEEITNELVGRFVHDYCDDAEWYWIADEIGGVIVTREHVFDLENMVQFMRHKYTPKQMVAYCDYALEHAAETNKKPQLFRIKNWRKLKRL